LSPTNGILLTSRALFEARANESRKIPSTHPQGVACAYVTLYIAICWDNWM
jgi:hypothetical protein